MGQAIAVAGGVAKMAESVIESVQSVGAEKPERVAELRERLTFLQHMAYTTIDAKTNEILHGQEGDLKIHGGTIVEIHKRAEIKHEDTPKNLNEAVDSVMTDGLNGVFSQRVKNSIGSLVKTAIATFFHDDSVGEVKYEDMIVVWDNNALLRVDYFLWRYNFSTKNILEHIDSVYAYVVIKRVIDVNKVSPEVVVYAISNGCQEENDAEVLKEVESVTKIIVKVKEMQMRSTLPAVQPSPIEAPEEL